MKPIFIEITPVSAITTRRKYKNSEKEYFSANHFMKIKDCTIDLREELVVGTKIYFHDGCVIFKESPKEIMRLIDEADGTERLADELERANLRMRVMEHEIKRMQDTLIRNNI